MEPEGSWQPATGPCSGPDELVHIFPPYFSKIHSNIIFLSMPSSSEWSLQVVQLKFYMNFSSLPCVVHALPTSSFWLDDTYTAW
jgi:hypothetical protein